MVRGYSGDTEERSLFSDVANCESLILGFNWMVFGYIYRFWRG